MSNTDYYYFRGMLNELKSQSTNHTKNSNHLEILKDTVVEINNNEIGDAQDGLRCYVFGHDEPNGKARALFCDSSHNLKVKDDDLLTKLTSVDTRLDSFSGAVNNSGSIGDGSTQLRAMAMGYDRSAGKARSMLVDSNGKVETNDADVKDKLTGSQTTSGVADILELLLFNAQQATQSIVISAMNIGITSTYNLQKYSKVSVIIKETLNTPSNTGYASLEWSDNDDVYTSTYRTQFYERKRPDNSTSMGFWCDFSGQSVMAKYMRVAIYNGDLSDSHTYDVDVMFLH